MSTDRALLLYGSHARGDADLHSDIDVLAVGPIPPSLGEIVELLPAALKGPLHISHYTWAELNAMGQYGSLFLHHIAAEAKAIQYQGISQKRLWKLLASLPPYRLARRDLSGFRVTLHDVEAGLRAGVPPCFEFAVMGGVARHASVLACYMGGTPCFGRQSIALAAGLLHMPTAGKIFESAHRFRLFEEGQCATPSEATQEGAFGTLDTLSMFLDRLEVLIHANAA